MTAAMMMPPTTAKGIVFMLLEDELGLYEVFEKKEGRPARGPNTADRVSPGGFLAYEHQWAMGAAFRMHQQIGRARIAERIRELNSRCKEGLAGIKKVKLHTPHDGVSPPQPSVLLGPAAQLTMPISVRRPASS